MQREAALAELDTAREEWKSALAEVPDDALSYLKPGDDYALGGLQVHVNWVLTRYGRVLDGLTAGGFKALTAIDSPREVEKINQQAKEGLTARQRKDAVAEMSRLHANVAMAVKSMSAADWDRKTPVVYGAGSEPYPTSPEDIVTWLRDHYREHVQQSADLVGEWRSSKTRR